MQRSISTIHSEEGHTLAREAGQRRGHVGTRLRRHLHDLGRVLTGRRERDREARLRPAWPLLSRPVARKSRNPEKSEKATSSRSGGRGFRAAELPRSGAAKGDPAARANAARP